MSDTSFINIINDKLNSDTNICIIKNYSNELKDVIEKIKGNTNYIFNNCTCQFEIAEKRFLTRYFDKAIYSEESNVLILVIKDCNFDYSLIIEELLCNNIEESCEQKDIDSKDNDKFNEVWYVHNIKELDKAFNLFSSNHDDFSLCTYYPSIIGKMIINHNTDKLMEIESKGLLILSDRSFVLLSPNFNLEDVYAIIDRNHYNCITLDNTLYPEELL